MHADWGVKSRTHMLNVMMNYFGHGDKYQWVKEIPFPGADGWDTYADRSQWGHLP